MDSVGNEVLAPCLNELLDIEYFDNFPAWTSRENVYLAKVKKQKGLDRHKRQMASVATI